MRRELLGAVAGLSLVLTLGSAPAAANDGDKIREGPCTGASTWKLKASPENGRIEVEGEVDSNVNGQTWRWRMFHNGDLTARGRAATQPPSGSFERRRVMVNLAGVDRFRFVAKHRRSGERCVGRVRF